LYKPNKLGNFLGIKNLWLKNETENFTRTFKAREALVSLSRFQEIGLVEFAMCSTGNTAAAFSYAMRFTKKPMTIHMFFPKWTVIDIEPRTKGTTTVTIVNGDYDMTIRTAYDFCTRNGLAFEGGFANPSRIEGSKTIAYEIAETDLEPDWYVQSVTSGTGVYALRKGYRELQEMGAVKSAPRILCVQPESCAPMVHAFRKGKKKLDPEDRSNAQATFATTLSNANPAFSYPYVRKAVLDSAGHFEDVSEAETARAFLLLFKLEKLLVDPASAVALAGIIKTISKGRIDREETILLNVSGGIRKEEPSKYGRSYALEKKKFSLLTSQT